MISNLLSKLIPSVALLLVAHPSFAQNPFGNRSSPGELTSNDLRAMRGRYNPEQVRRWRQAFPQNRRGDPWAAAIEVDRDARLGKAKRVNHDPNDRGFMTPTQHILFKDAAIKRSFIRLADKIHRMREKVQYLSDAKIQSLFAGTPDAKKPASSLRRSMNDWLKYQQGRLEFRGEGIADFTVGNVSSDLKATSWVKQLGKTRLRLDPLDLGPNPLLNW